MKTGSSCREHVRQRISLSFQSLFLRPWEDVEIHNTIFCNFDHRGWCFESVYGVYWMILVDSRLEGMFGKVNRCQGR